MTVSELRQQLADLEDDEMVPLSMVIPELTYVVATLEQWAEIAELFGRSGDPEVQAFLAHAYASL